MYDFQRVHKQHCLDLVDSGHGRKFRGCLLEIRDVWFLQNTEGPMAEMLPNRLYGTAADDGTVDTAQIRWHRDGETVAHRELVRHQLRYSGSWSRCSS